METAPKTTKPKPTRWWPAVMIVSGFALAVALICLSASEDQANRVLAILSATALASILLVMWMLFFSRLAKRNGTRQQAGGKKKFHPCQKLCRHERELTRLPGQDQRLGGSMTGGVGAVAGEGSGRA